MAILHYAYLKMDHQRELAAEQLDQGDDDFPATVEQYHVFTTLEKDKRSKLWYEAEVNAAMPAEPQCMHWFEAAITWGRNDHPPLMPSPEEYALVLDPIMRSDTHTCRFSRVLIDEATTSTFCTEARWKSWASRLLS
jgi:hypothetical protein